MNIIITFIISFIITFPIGYLCAIHKIKKDNSPKQSLELMDADIMFEISKVNECTFEYTKIQKDILKEITKRINDSALEGFNGIILSKDLELNHKIDNNFTKKQIKDFFHEKGYKVYFRYDFSDYADIEKIMWNEAKKK